MNEPSQTPGEVADAAVRIVPVCGREATHANVYIGNHPVGGTHSKEFAVLESRRIREELAVLIQARDEAWRAPAPSAPEKESESNARK